MKIVLKVSPRLHRSALDALFASAWSAGSKTAPLRFSLFYVCAYAGKRLVGFAKVVGDGGVHGFLLDPTVHLDWQRKGIGRKLVEKCALESRRRGIEWLHVDFEPPLAKFYRACGFSHTHAGLRNLRKKS